MGLLRASLDEHRRLLGSRHRDTGVAAQELAGALVQSDPAEAMQLLDEAMVIAEVAADLDTLAVAGVYNRLGMATMIDGNYELAVINFQKALVLMDDHLGDEHPYVLAVRHNLATSRNGLGEWAEAEAIHRQLLVEKQKVLGPETMAVARSWDSLANSMAQQGRHDEALEAYQEAENIYRRVFGPASGEVGSTYRNEGVVLMARGYTSEALERFDLAIAIDEAHPGFDLRVAAPKRGHRALALFVMGEREGGMAAGLAALGLADSLARNESDPYRADLRGLVVTMLLAEGRALEAEPLARKALEIRAIHSRDPSAVLARERCLLGAALESLGQRDEATQLLRGNHEKALSWGLLFPIQREIIMAALISCDIP